MINLNEVKTFISENEVLFTNRTIKNSLLTKTFVFKEMKLHQNLDSFINFEVDNIVKINSYCYTGYSVYSKEMEDCIQFITPKNSAWDNFWLNPNNPDCKFIV